MAAFAKRSWNSFLCSPKELRLDISLKCGQSFRWKSVDHEGTNIFIGVINKNLLLFKQDDNYLHYSVEHGKMEESIIKDYFNLSIDLQSLYSQWGKVDPIFRDISCDYPGVRMLRQDPVENLFSFICSANNNIQRISGMVENLAKHFGDKICEFNGEDYYAFPNIDNLAKPGVEEKLRDLGFGYRAKYIEESAKKILSLGGEDWLLSLRKLQYSEAKEALQQLSGIGPKVADCILLMSLDQPSSIPVDTHVFQIAKKYLPHLDKTKTVTNRVYKEIGDHFRDLYGPYAGWAHSVLFSADLKHLQNLKQSPQKLKLESIKAELIDNVESNVNGIKKSPKKSKKTKAVKNELGIDHIKQEVMTDVKIENGMKTKAKKNELKIKPANDAVKNVENGDRNVAKKRTKAKLLLEVEAKKQKA